MKLRKVCLLLLCFSLCVPGMSTTLATDSNGYSIFLKDGTAYPIDLVDQGREDGKLSIFTRSYGESTAPFAEDTAEVIIVDHVVVAESGGASGTYIPTNGYVLSGTGGAKSIVEQLEIGDSVTTNAPIQSLPEKYFIVNDVVVPITQIGGVRIAAAVVLYTPDHGATTGTNPWGMELTVVDGKVTRVVTISQGANGAWLDNNSPIPSNGYVLSVQSESPFFPILNGNVTVGADVVMDINNQVLFQAAKTTYHALNPKTREDNPGGWDNGSNAPYPGFRGADQLIVYDSSYGTSTGTNPWGYEVAVNAEGTVIQIGGNDTPIPQGGYVISGHGAMAGWLQEHVSVGASFRLLADDKEALFLFTPESNLIQVRTSIQTAEQALAESRRQFLDVDYGAIEQRIAQTKAGLAELEGRARAGDYSGFMENFRALDEEAVLAKFMNYESRAVDHRSVWMRPKETNLAQVQQNIAKLKALNINSLYLETWWNGHTIYPTEHPLAEQNPIYQGFDVLQAYIDEGKKAGIEIHAWVENFFIGMGNQIGKVRTVHPEWSMISRLGHDYQYVPIYSSNYYFINPALPEVRDFVSEIYEELLRKYDVDGLQLDYIRYPDAGDFTNDYGYDSYTRNLFMEQYGADPIGLYPGSELWEEWVNFRKNIINEFVYRISDEARAIKPNIRISAAVWPNYVDGPILMSQEPRDWLEKNYIDQLFPMSYNPTVALTAEDARESVELSDGKAFVVIGVGAFEAGRTSEVMIGQIDASMDEGVSGSALFEFEGIFNNGHDQPLLAGVYSKPAIVPDRDPVLSLRTVISEMERKIAEIYIPFGGMTQKASKTYLVDLNHFNTALKDKKLIINREHEIRDKIVKMKADLDRDSGVNAEVKERIKEDLAYFELILTVFLSKQ